MNMIISNTTAIIDTEWLDGFTHRSLLQSIRNRAGAAECASVGVEARQSNH